MAQEILRLTDVHTYYGETYALKGVSLTIEKGSFVGLLGRNGMGKTTVISSIIGFNRPRRGSIYLHRKEVTSLPSYRIAQMGLSLVPQGRRIFQSLTVEENLVMSACARKTTNGDSWNLDRVYSFFPVLKERARNRGNLLSGGEQQMLSIGRALMTNPDILLMDEPSEGLAPLLVKQISHILVLLKSKNLSLLLVEQNLPMALAVADSFYVISGGVIVYEGPHDEFKNNEAVKSKYIGIARSH